jgi:hypothetical protein
MVTAFWILYGAVIALRMAVFPASKPISYLEAAAWFASACLLGVWAFLKERHEREAGNKEAADLKQQLVAGMARLEGRTDIVALLQLQSITNTVGQPALAVIEAATTKITELEKKVERLPLLEASIKRYESIFWMPLTDLAVL